jgi:hypothetical protein
MLVFHCPTARENFTDDTVMDRESYLRQRMKIVAVTCPHCARVHRFLLADVELRTDAA